jgi:hypothetical protein
VNGFFIERPMVDGKRGAKDADFSSHVEGMKKV